MAYVAEQLSLSTDLSPSMASYEASSMTLRSSKRAKGLDRPVGEPKRLLLYPQTLHKIIKIHKKDPAVRQDGKQNSNEKDCFSSTEFEIRDTCV